MRHLSRLMTLAVAAGSLAAALVLPAVPAVAAPAAAAPAGFVSASGGKFILNGKDFRYGGSNNYYMIFGSQAMTDDVFADAKSMNLTVLRAWASLDIGSLDGSMPSVDGGPKADVYFQYWDPAARRPVYNDGATGLQRLDAVLAKAGQMGIKLILPFVNNWKEFGGMDQYVKWAGGQYHDEFYTSATIRQWYKDWIGHLLNRTNTVTGVKYKDDPAIFSWELGNEPRCINANLPASGTCTPTTLVNWVTEISAYVKSQDPNHMLSVGDEGFLARGNASDWLYNAADGVDHEAMTRVANIDYGTFHLYPNGWGRTADWGTQWIKDHAAAADAYGKPTILEEFGITGSDRDTVYKTWTSTVRTGTADGWNFWILTGVDWDGVSPYPDYDGFRVMYPSATATVLSGEAALISGSGGGGDTQAPTTPGTPTASTITSSGATLTWTASTDNTAVTGYDIVNAANTVLGSSTGATTTLTGLTPATSYTLRVIAKDAAGNRSTASASVTFTTTTGGGGGTCKVTYGANSWGGGFSASVTVTNTGTAPITAWTLRFTFPGNQQVTQGWSANWTQSGAVVTATNMPWNGSLAAGQSTGIGFNGSYTGTNTNPSSFTLNGQTCS
ncbi:cellulose binding domain-containing protein [Sphaerisporangium corydalis]|uniref:Cellulose binding domain-containing protein n=1 Tax=Sphaerisporangium corydalis TaxID=1441875 RepID=A0ABV9EHX3_9ACTN|nr:cellulose binding domain-containing protein [Sphaerisporangium corydalis]